MAIPSKTVSAEPLRQLIQERHPDNIEAFADLFAVGCLFHAQGKRAAGLKLIDQVTHAVEAPSNQKYLRELRQHLDGNEFQLAGQIDAHSEVNALLDAERRNHLADDQ